MSNAKSGQNPKKNQSSVVKKDLLLTTSTKRKKKVLSLEHKLRALQRIDAGEPPAKVAADLNIARSTIALWMKNLNPTRARRQRTVIPNEQKLCALRRVDAGESPVKVAADLKIGRSTIGDWMRNLSVRVGAKRKKNVMSMEQKLRALHRMDAGEPPSKVASDLNIGRSTITDWKKNRLEIEKFCSIQASGSVVKIRKTMRKGTHPHLEEALFLWHEQIIAKGVPVSGLQLHQKALTFYELIEGKELESFDSDGWLDRFKRRHGINRISCETSPGDEAALADFKKKLHTIIDNGGYTDDQLYNCDEIGLNYISLPAKILVPQQEETESEYKKNKKRVTVLACSNATGSHKLRLTLIGNSKKPRALFRRQPTTDIHLPLWYINQPKSWMSIGIFKEWFKAEFVPAVEKYMVESGLPRKALLLVDKVPSHAEYLQDGDIKVMYLPHNVASLCQPMEQGVLKTMKKHYRRKLLEYIIGTIDAEEYFVQTLNKIDVFNVFNWIVESWNLISPISLASSWKKLLDYNETQADVLETDDNDVILVNLLEKLPHCADVNFEDVEEWIKNDFFDLTDEEIVQIVTNQKASEEDVSDEEVERNIPHTVGYEAIQTALEYISQQEQATYTEIDCFQRWRNIAASKAFEAGKQENTTDFLIQKLNLKKRKTKTK